MKVEDIAKELGGIRKMANILKVSYLTPERWIFTGVIPDKYWSKLINLIPSLNSEILFNMNEEGRKKAKDFEL